MNIGVNSRIYQNANSGIPYYIKCLYETLQAEDKGNNYIFFQTKKNKTLGDTDLLSAPDNSAGAVYFDNFAVSRLVEKRALDVFHGPSNVLPNQKREGTKYIVTVHDLAPLVLKESKLSLFNLYFKYSLGKSLALADRIIAVSENTKEDILQFYRTPEDKIEVIYSGVNSCFKNSAATPSSGERLIKEKYIFSLTTHPKRKNIFSILEIFKKYRKELSDYKYVIAGLIRGEALIELEKKIAEYDLKNTIFFGYATEAQLINLYQNAELFIYPSFYEGFGFPILESMMCRCPVLASNTSSMKEIVPNQDFLIDPYDINDIYSKMLNALNLPGGKKLQLVESNYSFAKNFTWERTARETATLFLS